MTKRERERKRKKERERENERYIERESDILADGTSFLFFF